MLLTYRSRGVSLSFAIGAAAILTGCGSPAQTGSLPVTPASRTQAGAPTATQDGRDVGNDVCASHGGVAVAPCKVRFKRQDPTPVQLTVKYPNDPKAQLTEQDNCGSRATVSGSGASWTVTPGTSKGRCRAYFQYVNNGKVLGWARLHIRNRD